MNKVTCNILKVIVVVGCIGAALHIGKSEARSATAIQIPATMATGIGVERQANLCEMGYRRALRGDSVAKVKADLRSMPKVELNAVAYCYNQGIEALVKEGKL